MSLASFFRKKYILPLLLSLFIATFLIIVGGSDNIIRQLSGARLDYVAVGYLVFALTSFLRTLRFRVFPEERAIPFTSHHLTTSLYSVVVGVMPGAAGELSYPVLLKKNNNLRLVDGMRSVLVSRIYDLTVMTCLLLLSATFAFEYEAFSATQRGLLATVGIVLVLLILRLEWIFSLVERVTQAASGLVYAGLRTRLAYLLDEFKRVAGEIGQPKTRILLLLSTLALWITASCGIHFFLIALDTDIGLPAATLVTTSGILFSVAPITIAGIGLREAAYAGAMIVAGVEASTAASVAISLRILSLPVNFANLLLAYLLKFARRVGKWDSQF